MSFPPAADEQGTSTRPYLIRALHDWCTDNGFTPYLAVHVSAGMQVPMEYVKNNEIVLNVGFEATSALSLGNDFVSFKARFGGKSREISVPVDHVVAIYARENGQGMAFPVPSGAAKPADETAAASEPARVGLRLATPPLAEPAEPAEPAESVESAELAELAETPAEAVADQPEDEPPPPAAPVPPAGRRPALKRVK